MRRLWCAALMALGIACSDDPQAPARSGLPFAGVGWVAPDQTGRLVVGWNPTVGAARYNVYASLIEGRATTKAPVGSSTGNTLVIGPTTPNERHFITVRLVDSAGLEDGNTVEKAVVASPDTSAPQFTGPRAVTPLAHAGATVTWDAATDTGSPPEAISYDVLAGRNAQSLVAIGRTGRGETSFSATALGTPGEPFFFLVRARDVADNLSPSTMLVPGPLGPDAVAPSFVGCNPATDIGSRSVTVSWKLAADDTTKPSDISYEVYAATTAGAQDFAAAPLVKVPAGTTSVSIKNLDPGKTYFFVCRGRDAAGNLDTNKSELRVTMATDVTAPVFSGLTNAVVDGFARTALLTWPAAVDETTAMTSLLYDVFQTKTPGVYDFTAPPVATSAPGATSLMLTNLEPRAALNWVVRARDAALNRDTNLSEKSGVMKTSYAVNVQPIFTRSCAVVGCHVSGSAPSGLNLAPAFAYDNIVAMNSTQKPPTMALPDTRRISQDLVAPLANSYLYEKITSATPFRGAMMPAPATGNVLTQEDKELVQSWILEGAKRN